MAKFPFQVEQISNSWECNFREDYPSYPGFKPKHVDYMDQLRLKLRQTVFSGWTQSFVVKWEKTRTSTAIFCDKNSHYATMAKNHKYDIFVSFLAKLVK